MIILVTGSAGMLGTDLCRLLAESGYFFIGTDIKEPNEQGLPADAYIQADITNRDKIEDILEETKPDIVIHTAAYTAVDACEINKELAFKINESGAANIAEAANKINATVIYISTDYVFDGKKTSAYEITDKVNPMSIYGKSKLAGEEAVRNIIGNKYIITRTSWLYGKYGPNFVDKIISKARSGEKLNIVNDQTGSPTSTIDLAQGLINICKCFEENKDNQNLYGIYHITNSNSCSWYDYTLEILKYAGIEAQVQAISTDELKEIYNNAGKRYALRPAFSVLNNQRFNDLTQKPLKTWQQALRHYLSQ
jgi:dTDP-4-dehydrorhamnose reductase